MIPETLLFQGVLLQAVEDAMQPTKGKIERGPDRVDRLVYRVDLITSNARAWLVGNSKDFQRVCEWALCDPEAVLDKMRQKAAAGWGGRQIYTPKKKKAAPLTSVFAAA